MVTAMCNAPTQPAGEAIASTLAEVVPHLIRLPVLGMREVVNQEQQLLIFTVPKV